MPGAVNAKLHTNPMSSRPLIQPSSSNNPIKHTPSEVISISDDDDDQITVVSAPKPKSRDKRLSSTHRLDVSSWNAGTKSTHHRRNRDKDSSSRSILSSSTIRSTVADQSIESKSLNSNMVNRKELFNSSQPHHAAHTKGKQPILHPSELPREQPQHSKAASTSPSKGDLNLSKTPQSTQLSQVTVDLPCTLKPAELQIANQTRTAKPTNKQSDVINKLNSFSHRPSSGSGSSSTRNDQTSDPVPSIDPKPVADKIITPHASETCWATSRIQQSMAARRVQQDMKRMELECLQSRGNINASGAAVSKDPATTPNTTKHLAVKTCSPHAAPSTMSSAEKGNDNAPSMHIMTNQKDNASRRDAIEAIFKSVSHTFKPSSDALHARKKMKHTDLLQSKPEHRFVELPDSDAREAPIPSTSLLPPHQSISNTTSFECGSQAKTNSTSHCAIHPVAFLPLPRVVPRLRPVSPDWTKIPLHRRPIQGRERPAEFSDELQKTWILANNPDLSTPLGQLIFTEEINANQMWENPEIPQVDVVVPDVVRAKMHENLKAERQGDQSTGSDQSLAPPLEFIYTDRLIYRNNERPIPPTWHCSCHGDCRNNPTCECRAHQTRMVKQIITAEADVPWTEDVKAFEGFAYVSTRKHRHSHSKKSENGDVEARCMAPMFMEDVFPVFECNSRCGCSSDCINRTVGRGRREKLSIQKTLSRGWGVFADHSIPMGRLVTHYSGEVITDAMSMERGKLKYDKIGRTYIFDLDPWWITTICTPNLSNEGIFVLSDTKKPSETHTTVSTISNCASNHNTNISLATSSSAAKKKHRKSKRQEDNEVECIYSVDAFLYGNISRFINHSCSANTAIVPVYIEDADPTRPIFAMFANKQIKAGMEITTSYSDPNAVEDKKFDKHNRETNEGRLGRYMECKCGASNCKGMMFA